ncbi:MAG: glycerol kinase GlpK [Pseudomonadota bacterium]
MSTQSFILTIDEGTTSTRVIAFDQTFSPVAEAQNAVPLQYPDDGWVEQDGEDLWARTLEACRSVIAAVGGAERIAGIGIANQRETTLLWDRATGSPIAPAIVWQDRRTADLCERLRAAGHERAVQSRTGLLIDPYFSGTKIAWLLDHVPGARTRAAAGDLAFGTIDSWLVWKLTGGTVHATDATNASRTLLYPLSLDAGASWDTQMLDTLGVPAAILPEVRTSAGGFGTTDPVLFGKAIPILSVVGDQQAALVGQGCMTAGTAKITYGTGAFLVANTGLDRPQSNHRLLGTVGYTVADGPAAFALEGSIFNAGTVVQWLRDDLGLIANAAESEAKAAALDSNAGVYLVPGFTGLGAPHWDAEARGLISGLTRAARAEHLVRAGLEAAAYQTRDLMTAFRDDGAAITLLKVDGGMAANDWLMQFVADICDVPVERPQYMEMTALGAAALAGMSLGWVSASEWSARETGGRRFSPTMDHDKRTALLEGWQTALGRAAKPT